MEKKKSVLGFVLPLFLVIFVAILLFAKGKSLFVFLVNYEILLIICFLRFGKKFKNTFLYKSFKKIYLKNEYITIFISMLWLVIDFFVTLSFMLLNYDYSFLITISLIQLLMDFILTFGIFPAISDIFKK